METKNSTHTQHQSHFVIVIGRDEAKVSTTALAKGTPSSWVLGKTSFKLTHTNYCFVDAVQDQRQLVALRVFLLGDLKVPAYFKGSRRLTVDSDTSFFVWLTEHQMPFTDEAYVSIQDLGEGLYENSEGEWLMLLATNAYIDLGLRLSI
jgi:hypothetical protein